MKEGDVLGKTYGEERKKNRAESLRKPGTEIRETIRRALEEKEIEEIIREIGEWTSKRVTAEKIFTTINEIAPHKALEIALTLREEESSPETVRAFWETVGIEEMEEDGFFAGMAFRKVLMPRAMVGEFREAWMEDAMIAAMRHPWIAKNMPVYKKYCEERSWWKPAKEQAGETILEALETNEEFAKKFVRDLRKHGEAHGEDWIKACAVILADSEVTAEKFIEVITAMREDPRESGRDEWKDNPWVDGAMRRAEEVIQESEGGEPGEILRAIRERAVKETTLNIVEETLKKKGLKGVVESIDEWVEKGRNITARDIFEIIANENDAPGIAYLLTEEGCSPETVNAFWEGEEVIEAMRKSGRFAVWVFWYIRSLYAEQNPAEQGQAWVKKALIEIARNTALAFSAAIKHDLFHKGSSWWDAYGKEEIREVAMESIVKALDKTNPETLKNILRDGDKYEERWIKKIARKMAERPESAMTVTRFVKFEGAELEWVNKPWVDAVIEKAEETEEEAWKREKERIITTDGAEEAMEIIEKINMFGHSVRFDDERGIEEIVSEAVQYYAAAEKFIEGVEERKFFAEKIERVEYRTSPWMERCYEKARELRERVAREAREHRDRIVEDRGGYTLSKEEFTEYFEPKTMRQGNVGNCYLVAAIYAMREWPHAEMVLRKSVKRNLDGSWEVQFPLMDAAGETVTVTREDMRSQENKMFRRKISGKNRIDYRKILNPLTGPEGYQALEAACTKKYFGEVDRVSSEGGYSSDTLKVFGGALFARDKTNSSKRNPGDSFVSNPEAAGSLLKNFDPEIYIATCSCSKEAPMGATVITERGDSEPPGVRKEEIKIKKHHAYAVRGVDKERKEVGVVNPHNTAEVLVMSFEKFREIFTEVETVRINNERLLEEYKKTDTTYNHEER